MRADILRLEYDPCSCDPGTSAWNCVKPTQRLKQAAAKALGDIKNPSAIPALRSGLEDACPAVRMAAAEAVGRFGSEAKSALPRLKNMTAESHPGIKKKAQTAINRIER